MIRVDVFWSTATLDDLFGDADDISSDEEEKKEEKSDKEEGEETSERVYIL